MKDRGLDTSMKRKTFREFVEKRQKWVSPAKEVLAGIKAVVNPFAGQRRSPMKAEQNPLSPVSTRQPMQ